ncbi:Gfo/Idh/MocA family oxidoreductase [Helicobacter sp. MIT 11-5569]|uniref:Gfo/Idh/MocA family protein n=1 Tax=Helicobacter sp. MIT 11-5569 TaxID=1548151 RepID=UPI00051F922B|nr:Gfo/Idh/MocA family oxidoreductase [Helicobacter sp. MIT 11-5569]TLD84586.1 Gfo/Idh/MocA family oxidoreductase [Helicobacter sp. MIT 11-5569]
MNNKSIKIGLLGIGRMGQNHLRILSMLKYVEICFIYDIATDAARNIATQYQVPLSNNLDEDLKKVDGVIIVTPTFTHGEYFFKIAPLVKNIFIEKPLAHTLEMTQKIAHYVSQHNISLQVGFIERYSPAVTALKKAIDNSNTIINMDFTRTNKISSRITDVDVVLDLMIHDIDLALSLNGDVKQVYAYGCYQNNMIEFARAIITHKNGVFSTITASRITEKRMRKISATCDNMYIDCNLLSKEVFVNKQSLEQYLENVSIVSKTETIDVKPREALFLELIDFVELCRGNQTDFATAQDALKAMEIACDIQSQIKKHHNETAY